MEGSCDPLRLIDRIQHAVTQAKLECERSVTSRAHQILTSIIRRESALKTAEKKAWLLKRAIDVCRRRNEMLSELKKLQKFNGNTSTNSSSSLCEDVDVSHCAFFPALHEKLSAAIARADEACTFEFPAVSKVNVEAAVGGKRRAQTSVHANEEESSQQHLPVLDSMCSLPAENVELFRCLMDGEGDTNDASQGGGDESSDDDQRMLANQVRLATLPPLQRLPEDDYLTSVVLSPLTAEVLRETTMSCPAGEQGKISQVHWVHRHIASSIDRLAVRAALVELSNDPRVARISKKRILKAATTQRSENKVLPLQVAAVVEPISLLASSESLPVCVSHVYAAGLSAALESAFSPNGGRGTVLAEMVRCMPGLDRGALVYLVEMVLEPARQDPDVTQELHEAVETLLSVIDSRLEE